MKTKTTRTARRGDAARRPTPSAPEKKAVAIKPAKGRPMLTWVGKRPLRHVAAFPAQLVETFSALPPSPDGAFPPGEGPGARAALLFHGDNKDVLAHQPARAKVGIKRARDKIKVEIKDFISPTILERLKQQAGILTPQIDDWRAMVDSVMIDTAYNGETFNIALADVPEKKTYLVAGEYELDAPKGETTVAVKITDMLGEEVLVIT